MKNLQVYTMLIGLAFFIACSPGKKNEHREGDNIGDFDGEGGVPESTYEDVVNGKSATADIYSASGSEVEGTATFAVQGDQIIRMELELRNVSPGTHALHLHENGDCSAEDASSAGGHWNPTDEKHGKRGEGEFHKGDIGNLEVGDDGQVSWSEEIEGWTIGGPDSTNILNKAVIIHEGADDFTSQPSGDAGARIACGVIKMR